jgi:hypothetical protein
VGENSGDDDTRPSSIRAHVSYLQMATKALEIAEVELGLANVLRDESLDMELPEAEQLALWLKQAIGPACHRCEWQLSRLLSLSARTVGLDEAVKRAKAALRGACVRLDVNWVERD